MKQCPNCGNANNDFDTNCSFCGYQLDQAASNNSGSFTGAENNPSNNDFPGSSINENLNNNIIDNNNSSNNNGSNDSNGFSQNYSSYSPNTNNNYSSGNYNTPYYQGNAPAQPKTNSFAIASLILAIASIPLLCCCVGIITAVLAVIFGFIARNKIINSNGYETGNGLAMAGIIVGFAALGIGIVMTIMYLSGSGTFWNEFNKSFQEQFQKQLERQQAK